ncbi:hypothetical protein UA74_27310 [Actinoalloteichus fjordicus]|uniref:Uncharacterized protein n=1 Tax=Actinoalloteichus fjordicus TaxID=1612552 RepID=A0AAC9PUU9_9PSEU|nr:hypothetical protein UA74_27310 [Actinoalloteichus fjordicus]
MLGAYGGISLDAALINAVETRLEGRAVGADLAGLDSTTPAWPAARRCPVRTVTFADELAAFRAGLDDSGGHTARRCSWSVA